MTSNNFELIEKQILATMMRENYLIDESGVTLEHFNSTTHKNIFSTMTDLIHQNMPVDAITLMAIQSPELLGGANYLMELQSFSNPAKFDSYTKLLINHWKELKKREILFQAQQEDWPIGLIQKTLDDLETNGTSINASIKEKLAEQFERPYKPEVINKGVPSGLKDLDIILGGFRKNELTIIAARPSLGKSDVMTQLSLHAGSLNKLPIIFSLEMSEDLLIDRMIANIGNYNRLKMRDPYINFSEEQKKTWPLTLGELDKRNVHIDDRSGLTVSQIKATARKIIRDNPTLEPIIFIDYLQKIRGESKNRNASKNEEVGDISSGLKDMAKEFGCPVICLSQLSRGVETRQDKRPVMSDLRDSGNIEQDADVIILLFRDDYYEKESEYKNMLELIVAKQRNGPTETATVMYVRDTGRLRNIDWSQKHADI